MTRRSARRLRSSVAVEELGCKGVAEEMRVEAEAETSAGARHRINDGPLADAAAPGDKERIARPECVPRGQVGVERTDRDDVERHDAILASLAPYPQAAGLAGIVARAGGHHLATAEPGECQERQDGAVPRIGLAGDGGFGLVPLEHPRQMPLALRHGEGADGIALEVAAVDQPGPEAAQLDESPAQRVGAPSLAGHVALVVAEAGRREGAQGVLPPRTGTAVEEVGEKLGKVTAVGGDGLCSQPLLDLAVVKKLVVQARECHRRGLAPECRYGRRSAARMRADGAASGVTCSSGPSVSTPR